MQRVLGRVLVSVALLVALSSALHATETQKGNADAALVRLLRLRSVLGLCTSSTTSAQLD